MDSIKDTQPIHVCFISPKAYPLFNPEVESFFGGAEVDLYLLATELARDRDLRVSFIVADYGQNPVETRRQVTVIKSLALNKNALSGAARIWRALRRANAQIYILKTASAGVPLVALFCRLHGRNFVYRTASNRECNGTYRKGHFFLGRAFAWSLRRAGIVFTQNDSDKRNLKNTMGVSSTVIANGQKLPEISPVRRDAILWAGRSVDFKKPERFFTLAKCFPGEKFVMICQQATGDDRYELLRRRAESISNLEFHERVSFPQIDSYFQTARVLVNTSDSEGFPNTFVQACMWGTAILSLTVNPDGFLDRYHCGLCCGGDENRLAEGLKSMLANDRYILLGQNGRKYAQDHHDITKIAQRYKTIFKNILYPQAHNHAGKSL